MNRLLVQVRLNDRHEVERVLNAEPLPDTMSYDLAKREAIARNTSRATRPAPNVVWQVRDVGELSKDAVGALAEALDAILQARTLKA